MDKQLTKIIIASGKVQGVYFRQSAKEQANALGVKGTVRNMTDGQSVEIIATGSEEKLQALVNWCRLGPPKAIIQNLEVKELPIIEFDAFDIIRQ